MLAYIFDKECHPLCNSCFDNTQYQCPECNSIVENIVHSDTACTCAVGFQYNENTFICDAIECEPGTKFNEDTNSCEELQRSKDNMTTLIIIIVSILVVGTILGIIFGVKSIRKKMMKCYDQEERRDAKQAAKEKLKHESLKQGKEETQHTNNAETESHIELTRV